MILRSLLLLLAVLLTAQPAYSQTFTNCNPLTTTCPPDAALGKSINVDFTKGAVNSFSASGNPTYDSNGVSFTVRQAGDAPQLNSLFYIMFGKVEVTMKAAPGAGIVSSFVLQSDDLDEIDLEWLGGDNDQVQTNYFGKGMTTTYNRGTYAPASNNQGQFTTYTVEWTAEQITWSVGGKVVRVLTPDTADANQYPQTPMQLRFGAWAGGDPSTNAPGTVTWAGGPVNYAGGPYTMVVQSLSVTDYSTGTQYRYGDMTGSWKSIVAVDGSINGNAGGASTEVATVEGGAVTTGTQSIPAGVGGRPTGTRSQTGWPYEATSTAATETSAVPQVGIPNGWVITSEGKVVPAGAGGQVALPVALLLASFSLSTICILGRMWP